MKPAFKNDFAELYLDDFPLVRVQFSEVLNTDEDLEEYLSFLKEEVMPKGKHMMLNISSKAKKMMTSKQRIRSGEFVKENEEFIKQSVIANATVEHNTIVKIIIDGIFLMKSYPVPFKTFKSIEKAEAWLNEELQKARTEGLVK